MSLENGDLIDKSLIDGLDEPVEQITTHLSNLFLTRDKVYKLKLSQRLPFVDQSTPALRRALCVAECTLNQRLTPGVYLGVVPLCRNADGRLSFGAPLELDAGSDATDGDNVVDYAVLMNRIRAPLLSDVIGNNDCDPEGAPPLPRNIDSDALFNI